MSSSSKILVLLDMNGALCYRHEQPVSGVRSDWYVRMKHHYKRHGVNDFIVALVRSGFFEVAVYSSMMMHNLEAALNALIPRETRNMLCAVLDRAMNKPDPNGQEEWDTIRDLQKVWRTLPGYGSKNTILLDNEARKFGEYPRNGIVVPEFGPLEVRSRKTGTMDSLLAYLLALGRAAPANVQDYMQSHPFVRPAAADIVTTAAQRATPSTSTSTSLLAEELARLAVSTGATSSPVSDPATAKQAAAPGNRSDLASATGTAATIQPAGSSAAAAAPAAGGSSGSATGDAQAAPVTVPEGTRMKFVCLED